MVIWNTGNYKYLSRPVLDVISSRELSQIVLPRRHLSILGTLCYASPVAPTAPCDQVKELCMYLFTSLRYELLESGALLGAARCFPL